MKKHLSAVRTPLGALVVGVAGLLLLLFTAYGLTRLASRGEVMGRVEVAGTQIGGLDEEQALSALLAVEEEYLGRPAVFNIEGKFVSMQPPEAGLDIDEQAIADEALLVGRNGNVISEFAWWLTHIFDTVHVPVRGSVDDVAIEEVFDIWDTEVIALPPSLGGVVLTDGRPAPVYPEVGTGVDRPPARAIVEATLLALEPEQTSIPTATVVPILTDEDVDRAVDQAEAMLVEPIQLDHEDVEVVFTVDQLTEAFRSETVTESEPRIVNSFDPEAVDGFLNPIREDIEAEPVNATYEISGDSISIVPGSSGTRIDADETSVRLADAAMTEERTGELPLVEAAEPEVTTEYLESLNINHLVAQFTTYHDCCEDRVVNIHRIADEVDGAIVLSGQTFSLNDHVGQRTLEDGYLPAGTIIAGEVEDTVGGGVSQFTTTLYNAVFWGGYEDVEHKPHSYYFTRYPEGVEATLNWRSPDLKFRNNTDNGILIDTTYTDTSITVRIFGENDGRTLKGEQSGGSSRAWVDTEGGPNALHVKGLVSDRFALTDPPEPRYEPNPDFGINQQDQTQTELGGWSVTVIRRILLGGDENQVVNEQEWTVRYAPRFAVYEVHPCMVPGTSTACPTTTTPPPTTIPPTTQPPPTTVPPTTTTTISPTPPPTPP
ncbi:MAG: VanW family protein [Acidimicrobiia bacterium]